MNDWYKMVKKEFPEQYERMQKWGRRSVSFSTVAPTGTVSLVAILNKYSSTSGGIEPHFALYFFRNRKVNPSDKTVRVDFVDQNGDSWQTYPVIMGGLKEWYDSNIYGIEMLERIEDLSKESLETIFKKSPYFGSTAEDISWEKRIEIQSIVQKYTTNAISSTINLSKDTTKEVVGGIYKAAWKAGLKGVTVYRDGSRTGILVKEENKKSFDYKDALKRPKSIDAELYPVTVQGKKYVVVVGLVDDKPYEVFAFENDTEIKRSIKGKVVKVKKGHYNFINGEEEHRIDELQIKAGNGEEQTLTRLVSGMLRHGANPKFVAQQIERSELSVVSFGKAISRILNKYTKEEKSGGCPECGGELIRQEGCTKCSSCSYSKC